MGEHSKMSRFDRASRRSNIPIVLKLRKKKKQKTKIIKFARFNFGK